MKSVIVTITPNVVLSKYMLKVKTLHVYFKILQTFMLWYDGKSLVTRNTHTH